MDQRLELPHTGMQKQSPHRHAAQAPALDSGDSLTGRISANEVAAEKEMRVHWGKSIEAVRPRSQPRRRAQFGGPQIVR